MLIYLDYNASTPVDERVLSVMLPYFREVYGNPSNGYHWQGRISAKAIAKSRESVARLLGARPSEIVYTSGATESNNLAILGLARSSSAQTTRSRSRIMVSAVEHKSVLNAADALAAEGFEVIRLPVDGQGRVQPEEAEKLIDANTLLVSVQAANNETGVLHSIPVISAIAHRQGAFLHCDAAQAVGKVMVDVQAWDVDMLSLSGHKLYGPKGTGALYVKDGRFRARLRPLLWGGSQEKHVRPGTENVPGIVGLGEACRLAEDLLQEEKSRIQRLRDALENELIRQVPECIVNSSDVERLPNTISVTFPGIGADSLLLSLPQVMMGTGSACTSGSLSPSHVLLAMGLDAELASSTVRISLGRFTTDTDVDGAVSQLVRALAECKEA